MSWDWLKKLIVKIAAEVHKSKIEEFEKRILKMEQEHAVISKTLIDNQNKIEKLEDKLYNANMDSAKAYGTIQTLITLIQTRKSDFNNLPQENKDYDTGDNK